MSSLIKQQKDAPAQWRSLEEFSQSDSFQEFLHREFPQGAAFLEDEVTRRNFLKTMGASVALAGMTGCRIPKEEIVPYVKDPEGIIPGKAKYFATTASRGIYNYGILAESHEGRPTKIEGNDKHEATLGASSMYLQASVLDLYDPERLQFPTYQGEKKTWSDVQSAIVELRKKFLDNKGKGLVILSGASYSPTISRLRAEVLKMFPAASWFAYEPVHAYASAEVMEKAAGKPAVLAYRLNAADVVFSLGDDLFGQHPEQIRLTKEFVALRKVEDTQRSMNRLYVAEAPLTLTGGMADHRFILPVSQYGAALIALAQELQKLGVKVGVNLPTTSGAVAYPWLAAVAKDLVDHKGRSVVAVGDHAPQYAHILGLAINAALGNLEKTVMVRDIADAISPDRAALQNLRDKISQGGVETLLVLDVNPAYVAGQSLDYKAALAKVANTICVTSEATETSELCKWVLPLSHYLESWGDAKSIHGQLSPIQPLIRPLFETKSIAEVLNMLVTGAIKDAYEIVKDTWRMNAGGAQPAWNEFLRTGVSSTAPKGTSINLAQVASWIPAKVDVVVPSKGALDVLFAPCAKVFDGRYANNAWLQECPDPINKTVWENPILLSVKTAEELGVKTGQILEVTLNGAKASAPVWVSPGFAEHTLGLTLGYGRSVCGHVGKNTGVSVYGLRTTVDHFVASGATVVIGAKSVTVPSTQNHWSMEGRPVVRTASLEDFKQNPRFAKEMVQHPPLKSLWKEHEYKEGFQWGMTIDLNACTGCSSCIIACQSENNIPVVGREQVIKQRDMHWIRVDRYYEGDPSNPEMVVQPLTCQHCENAPCEQVCPVNATVHDHEGLNAMVYNRCIGTRYCSNNCPYKVRRFNFFNYDKDTPELTKMQHNPDVTVRTRGVMEKCTFCIQRINEKKIELKDQNRKLNDGELQTACQQSCAASAISFGNLMDSKSKVKMERSLDRAYELLAELNTKPRNSFLAKLRNPNPALVSETHAESHGGHS